MALSDEWTTFPKSHCMREIPDAATIQADNPSLTTLTMSQAVALQWMVRWDDHGMVTALSNLVVSVNRHCMREMPDAATIHEDNRSLETENMP